MRFLALMLLFLSGCAMASSNEKIIYGYVEKVWLNDVDHLVSAKLDTGAKSASLNAVDIREVEEGDKVWLQFKVPTKHGMVELKREYVGSVKIKTRAEEKRAGKRTSVHRPIVLMKMRLGNVEKDVHVNLTNRNRFNYPLLLGRDAIVQFSGVVDPALKFTAKLTKE